MCVFSTCNNSLACQGVCCSRRTGPEEGFQADLATLECAAFQPSTTPSQASPTNPGSDPHTGDSNAPAHANTQNDNFPYFFLNGELVAGWWRPGLNRQSPWRAETSLKDSVHIIMHIFIIHRCSALLAAGPRPHGSMRSLACSFVWHKMPMFEAWN